jgi:molybdopterin molybdotransferase
VTAPALLSVAEAHARLMALFSPLPAEMVPLAEAGGRVLARDVVALRDQPPFAASAMDGYACRAADAAPGARLRVIGVAQAGARFEGAVRSGEAVRIYTGAPVPDGADLVVIQEEADREGAVVTLCGGREGGANIRPAGGDFRVGARFAAPRRLSPGDVALLAAMNAGEVAVTRRPVVALIATGDELAPPGGSPQRDQIIASNAHGLKAMLDALGAEARLLPIARDTPEDLRDVLALGAGADVVVTIGGASVGDFDIVRQTAEGLGFDLSFHKVAMRPGKPLLAGRIGAQILIGLPGNPVSAMVCGRIFLQPAVERMLGLCGSPPQATPARLAAALGPNGPRTHYMRAQVSAGPSGWICAAEQRQDSSLLSVLAAANALLVRPSGDGPREAGDMVEFIWI